jgi:hypothetical protein
MPNMLAIGTAFPNEVTGARLSPDSLAFITPSL